MLKRLRRLPSVLRPESAGSLLQTLRKSAAIAATATLSLAALLLLAALLINVLDPDAGTLDDPESFTNAVGKPLIAPAPYTLNIAQAEARLQDYLALQLWAEATLTQADQSPQDFHQVLVSKLPRDCVRDHWSDRNQVIQLTEDATATASQIDLAAGSMVDELINCAAADLQANDPRLWNTMELEQHQQLLERQLEFLWLSVSPVTLVTAILAQRGREPQPQTDNVYRSFSKAYNGCRDDGRFRDRLRHAIDPEAQAGVWLAAHREMSRCASEITQIRFPLPTKAADAAASAEAAGQTKDTKPLRPEENPPQERDADLRQRPDSQSDLP